MVGLKFLYSPVPPPYIKCHTLYMMDHFIIIHIVFLLLKDQCPTQCSVPRHLFYGHFSSIWSCHLFSVFNENFYFSLFEFGATIYFMTIYGEMFNASYLRNLHILLAVIANVKCLTDWTQSSVEILPNIPIMIIT